MWQCTGRNLSSTYGMHEGQCSITLTVGAENHVVPSIPVRCVCSWQIALLALHSRGKRKLIDVKDLTALIGVIVKFLTLTAMTFRWSSIADNTFLRDCGAESCRPHVSGFRQFGAPITAIMWKTALHVCQGLSSSQQGIHPGCRVGSDNTYFIMDMLDTLANTMNNKHCIQLYHRVKHVHT